MLVVRPVVDDQGGAPSASWRSPTGRSRDQGFRAAAAESGVAASGSSCRLRRRQPVDIPALVPNGRHSTFRRTTTGAPEPLVVGRHGGCDARAAMTTHRTASGRHTIGAIALVAALSCAAPSPRLTAQLSPPAAENAPVPSAEEAESFWPHRIDAEDQTILVYQPQVESWVGTQLSGRAALGGADIAHADRQHASTDGARSAERPLLSLAYGPLGRGAGDRGAVDGGRLAACGARRAEGVRRGLARGRPLRRPE